MGPIVCDDEGPRPALYKVRSESRGLCGSENSIELQGCFIVPIRSGTGLAGPNFWDKRVAYIANVTFRTASGKSPVLKIMIAAFIFF